MDTQGDIQLGMITWTCIVALGHAYVDMRGMTANMATSWTVSWGLRFYDQPSGGTTRRDWIRWTSSSPFATVSDCVVCMGFDRFLVACVPTSLSHCFYCIRGNAFSCFLSIVDYRVTYVRLWVGWVIGWLYFSCHAAVVRFHFPRIHPHLCPCMGPFLPPSLPTLAAFYAILTCFCSD